MWESRKKVKRFNGWVAGPAQSARPGSSPEPTERVLSEREMAARRRNSLSTPAAVPERRGLHEAGAGEDGGDAEDDEGADVHGALPRLLVLIFVGQ